MTAPAAHVVLRDRALVDVFDLAVRFVAAHAARLWRPMLALLAPGFALCWLVGVSHGWIAAWIAALALGMVAQAPFTLFASRLVFDDRASLSGALRDSVRAASALVVVRAAQAALPASAALLLALAVGSENKAAIALAALFCVLIGLVSLWLGALFVFAPEAAMLERGGATASLRRARALSGSSPSDALLTLVAIALVVASMVLVAEYAGRSLLEDLLQVDAPPALIEVGGSPLALAGFWLSVPYVAVARLLAYLNVRTRVEAWDVQTRFFALAARAQDAETLLAPRRAS